MAISEDAQKFADLMDELWPKVAPIVGVMRTIVQLDLDVDPLPATAGVLAATSAERASMVEQVVTVLSTIILADEVVSSLGPI